MRESDGPIAPRWRRSLPDTVVLLLIAGAAAILLFANLGVRYLWQDEAATAVLGERMMKFGKPLAYDGVNLLTTDHAGSEDETSLNQRTGDAQSAVDHYVRKGDLKSDTTWKWQPWGQFLLAGLSLKLFGHRTAAARWPFALAGLLTVIALYALVRRRLEHSLVASLAAGSLVANVYWILHARQSRYYALSSLFLTLTLMGWCRWQAGERWGAAAFVIAGWCWFQCDYGTFWPMMGVLLMTAALWQWPRVWKPMPVGLALLASILPFMWYYELWGRRASQRLTWNARFLSTLFDVNQFVAPVSVVLVAGALLALRWRLLAQAQRQLLVVATAVLAAMLLWIPSTAPWPFYRYMVMLAPVGCLLVGWATVTLGQVTREQFRSRGSGELTTVTVAVGLAIVVALTPWAALPVASAIPRQYWMTSVLGVDLRHEFTLLAVEVFGDRPDNNKAVIDYINKHARPGDEVLINYEDIPVMFYTGLPVRGGVAAFRVEDRSKDPRFIVIRRSVPFVYWPVFEREVRRQLQRHRWRQVKTGAIDTPFGNNPDPGSQVPWGLLALNALPEVLVLERMDDGPPAGAAPARP